MARKEYPYPEMDLLMEYEFQRRMIAGNESEGNPQAEREVREALLVLSPLQLVVVVHLAYDQLTIGATADLMGVSSSTVKVHYARALEKIERDITSTGRAYQHLRHKLETQNPLRLGMDAQDASILDRFLR